MRRLAVLLLAGITVCVAGARLAAEETTPSVFRGARILTATGETFDPGTLVVEKGKITAVGPAEDVNVPEGSAVHDLSGKVIIPGLVDSHSHLGVYPRPAVSANSDGNEMTGPVQGAVRALDSLNPDDPGMRMAVAGGVTVANIMPGSGNVIGGQTIYVKLRGETPEEMRIEAEGILGGLKMANGENPKRSYGSRGKAPDTRMKIAALQRQAFVKAQNYRRKWEEYRQKQEAGEQASPPDVDLSLEPLVEVLEGKRTVHFHTHRADDILTILRLKREFGFDLVIQHGTEAYKVAEQVARYDAPVSMTIVDSPGGKAEVVDFTLRCGALLEEAGVKVLINTDDPITSSRFLLRTAALAVRGGLSRETALQTITLYPAQAMRLDGRVGSLEPGKDADFVVLSGKPFSVYTRVLQTFIDGNKVFDLSNRTDRLYQTGGFAVADAERVPNLDSFFEPEPAVEKPEVPENARKPTDPPFPPPCEGGERGGRTGQDDDLAVLAGRLYTVDGDPISDGAVLVEDGRITYVGPRKGLNIPDDVPVISAAVVTPGLIDAHTVVPLAGEYNIPADQDANETTDPNQADLRVLDAFNPDEPLLRYLLQQGVTVVHACPGRANVIAGMTGVFRTHGNNTDTMALRFPYAMLFNLGNDPKQTYDTKPPDTRMGSAALIRKALTDASNYSRKRDRAAKNEDASPPNRNLKHEALSKVLKGDLAAMLCAHRKHDILTALRLVREFELNGRLALATEAYLAADEIHKARVPVIVHPTMQRVGGLATYKTFLGNAAALADRDLRIAIGSGVEGYVPKTRVVRYEAAMAMVYGLSFERALRAVTLDAARILGIDDRFGSLEVGKVGDLVLYDGNPFEHATHPTHVVVGGRVVYERSQ